MTIMRKNITLSLLTLFMAASLWISFSTMAMAEDVISASTETMDMPATTTSLNEASGDAMTHPIMRITQDKSELVKLEQEAGSVVVGNPDNISVLLDTPDTLVVIPRAAGASHFTVIGKDGSILMQRHVIVGAQKEKYVRIRRSCNAATTNCEQMSTYFCPDSCHEVTQPVIRQRR